MRSLPWVLITLAALSAACEKTPEPEASSPAPKPVAPETAQASGAQTAPKPESGGPSDVAWDAPPAWTKAENPSPMRKATYKIAKAAGDAEDAELSVSQAGGSVSANVDRWTAQFDHPSDSHTTQRVVGDLKVTIVELSGTFSGGGMPGMGPSAPKKGWAMVAAIVDTAPARTFFKLTGPSATVTSARGDFDKLVSSLKPK